MTPFVEFWQGRSARERLLLVSLIIVLLGAVWLLGVVSLLDRTDSVRQRLDAERVLLERVNSLSGRVQELQAPQPRSDISLLLLANRTLRDAGLQAYLEDSSADGERRVRLGLRNVPFPQASAWLAGLAIQEGIHAVSADIEAGEASGLAHLSLVLERRD